MKSRRHIIVSLLGLLFPILQGCIHDHPFGKDVPVVNPENVSSGLEISFNLTWDHHLHQTDFTRALSQNSHRFVIETLKNGDCFSRNEVFLSDSEFSSGSLIHKFSSSFNRESYQLAVWYEKLDPENDNNSFFNSEDLGNVTLLSETTTHGDTLECGYASEILDLRDASSLNTSENIKEVKLNHAGAKFRIVTTDIQEFIAQYRSYLLQGDRFFVNLRFSEKRHSFNLYDNKSIKENTESVRRGPLVLPFADYTELKIADGFVFTDSEEEIDMILSITNTTGQTISQTNLFTFPVKRGIITTVRGNFLSHPIDGSFTVNPVWDGEIEIEI